MTEREKEEETQRKRDRKIKKGDKIQLGIIFLRI